jgi:hypothetical protein
MVINKMGWDRAAAADEIPLTKERANFIAHQKGLMRGMTTDHDH